MTDAKLDLRAGPPPIPLALVEYLEAVYPDRFPAAIGQDPLPDFYRHDGRLQVVRFLRDHATRQSRLTPPTTASAS